MITLSQIKAARALLGWTQENLAHATGLSLPSINNLERGLYSPRQETLTSIVTTLEQAGIEFTPKNGLRLRQEDHDIITFIGTQFIDDLDRDILAVLTSPQDEIVGMSCDDRKWMDYAGISNPVYVEARAQKKWKERFLIPDTTTFITSPAKAYRVLPSVLFGKISYEIYGQRLAMIEWDAMRVTIIKNQLIADTFKKQFESLWKMAKPLTAKQINKMEQLDLEKSN